MDKKIEDFKKYYLETKPPMEASSGFAEILIKLDQKKEKNLYQNRFLFAGILLAFMALVISILVFPQNPTVNAVKNAANYIMQSVLKPSVTPIPSPNINSIIEFERDVPTITPSSKPTDTPQGKPSVAPGIKISSEKRSENPTDNDEKVKGVSDEHVPDFKSSQGNENGSEGNAEDHRNENSINNPSSEKSENGKGKNN